MKTCVSAPSIVASFWRASQQLERWTTPADHGLAIDSINLLAAVWNMRGVDIDFVGTEPIGGCPRGEACCQHIYDAVLVANTDASEMIWHLEEGWSTEPRMVGAAPLIDREKDDITSINNNWWSAYLSVVVDNEYETYEHLSAGDVWALDSSHRTIDLEQDPEATWDDAAPYYTVSADP